MQTDQYTADAITQSMGLGSFLDPTVDTSTYTLRLVLKPSFHPEFCIDVKPIDSQFQISAICLCEMLWRQAGPRRLPAFHERRNLSQLEADRFQSLCSTISADAKKPICVDGMGMNAAWTNSGNLIQFDSHVYGETVTYFVSTILEITWSTFKTPGIRNGIANCGMYVGLKYPLEPEPPKPTQLLLLGNPNDVVDFFSRFREDQDRP